MHSLTWHKNNCPCKGRPQPVSKKLAARREAAPADNGRRAFHMPGSQNRNK